jgi:hypothetical protein
MTPANDNDHVSWRDDLIPLAVFAIRAALLAFF